MGKQLLEQNTEVSEKVRNLMPKVEELALDSSLEVYPWYQEGGWSCKEVGSWDVETYM